MQVILGIFLLSWYIKVIGARSRSQEQKFVVGIAYQLVLLRGTVMYACGWPPFD